MTLVTVGCVVAGETFVNRDTYSNIIPFLKIADYCQKKKSIFQPGSITWIAGSSDILASMTDVLLGIPTFGGFTRTINKASLP